MSEIDDLKALIEQEKEERKQRKRDIQKRSYNKQKERMSAGELTIYNKQIRKRWEAKVGRKELTKRALAGRLRRQVLTAGEKPDRCEVCGRGGRIVFDHCHDTNKFRGWLCHNCNVVLGLVNDDRDILIKLVAYLNEREGN